MSLRSKIGVFGADKRQIYIAEALLAQGYHVCIYQLAQPVEHPHCKQVSSIQELFANCRVIVGPIPFAKSTTESAVSKNSPPAVAEIIALLQSGHHLIGGVMAPELAKACAEKGIPCNDLMKVEKVAILNAIATAEGSILEAIQASKINLHGSRGLIIGYGRCAKVLAEKLKGMACEVTIAARNTEALAYARAFGHKTVHLADLDGLLPSFDFIFNTVPTLVLDAGKLDLVSAAATLIDIASAPGGIDFAYAHEKKLNAQLCLGLPGKIAPKVSAEILVDEITTLLKERSG